MVPADLALIGMIDLKRGLEQHSVIVRSYFDDEVPPPQSEDNAFIARAAVDYLSHQLNHGWNPSLPQELAFTITNRMLAMYKKKDK